MVMCHADGWSHFGIFIQYVQEQLGEKRVSGQMKFALAESVMLVPAVSEGCEGFKLAALNDLSLRSCV